MKTTTLNSARIHHPPGNNPGKKNKALLCGLVSLATLVAVPLMARAGSWQPLNNQPPMPDITDPQTGAFLSEGGAAFPILLTDGSVIVQNSNSQKFHADGKVFKLTPDVNGSYLNGSWSQIASMPYIPTFSAQAVLADGRVIVEGGEYTGVNEQFTLTNQGAIYDPVADSWMSVSPPPFFNDLYPPRAQFAPHPIGDGSSVVLPDGTFMLQDKMSRQAALLNLATMTWTETGTATKSDLNDEEGWTLLPNGKVLTVDCYTDFAFGLIAHYPPHPTNSELYDPQTGTWTSAGSTINTLTDRKAFEMGPAVLRPDGTVFAVGSQGFTSIYHTDTGTWSVGPTLPQASDGSRMTAQDAPGALLPNGNVLIAASGGPKSAHNPYSGPPAYFFEFDGTNLIPEPAISNAAIEAAFNINLLVLPTGEILEADGSKDLEIYTPSDTTHNSNWEPVIMSAPSTVSRGGSYTITGIRFNGMSQASMFGDEGQNATNYPLVRITNLATKHVFYSRTHDHSSMAVASSAFVSTHFDVPLNQETGASKLEVVANGIASAPVSVFVTNGH
jgi:hypothetical protein